MLYDLAHYPRLGRYDEQALIIGEFWYCHGEWFEYDPGAKCWFCIAGEYQQH